jgi:hypothetical protein
MTGSVFYVLWILIEGGRSDAVATDHYATLKECEAARAAILEVYSDDYFERVSKRQIMCLEAKVN